MVDVKTTIANMSKATKKTTLDTLANALFTLGVGGLGLGIYSGNLIAGIFGLLGIILGIVVMYFRHRWNENGKKNVYLGNTGGVWENGSNPYDMVAVAKAIAKRDAVLKAVKTMGENDVMSLKPISTGKFTVEDTSNIDIISKKNYDITVSEFKGVIQGQKENHEIIEVKE